MRSKAFSAWGFEIEFAEGRSSGMQGFDRMCEVRVHTLIQEKRLGRGSAVQFGKNGP